jgi:SAM-dependent methyltransferase
MSQDWSGGYVTDIEYSEGFYPAQSPAHLALAVSLNGIEPPALDEHFTYCELGCGRGQTSLILAAVNPRAEFHAIDFHPAHIAAARERARRARIGNLTFHECGFDELPGARGAALPPFDVVTLHGVWSWIAPQLQSAIVEFLNARLKPGGLVYVSYNALPAWSSVAPLQRIIKELSRGTAERSDRAIVHVLEQVKRLRKANVIPAIFDDAIKRIENHGRASLAYLAHEYLNEYWAPVYHADVARRLAGAKLGFAAAADLLKNFYNLVLTEEQHGLLLELPSTELRETLRDFCSGHWFREDIFVRGARRMSATRRELHLAQLRLALQRPAVQIELERPDGSKWRPDPSVYREVIGALLGGPLEIRELLKLPTLPSNHAVGVVELAGVMLGTQIASVYHEPSPEERAVAARLNAWVEEDDEERGLDRGAALAVPAIRGGMTLSPASYALYAELHRGGKPEADVLAERFIRRCTAAGGHPIVDGKPCEDLQEARVAVTQDYEKKIEQLVPIWRGLGIL